MTLLIHCTKQLQYHHNKMESIHFPPLGHTVAKAAIAVSLGQCLLSVLIATRSAHICHREWKLSYGTAGWSSEPVGGQWPSRGSFAGSWQPHTFSVSPRNNNLDPAWGWGCDSALLLSLHCLSWCWSLAIWCQNGPFLSKYRTRGSYSKYTLLNWA